MKKINSLKVIFLGLNALTINMQNFMAHEKITQAAGRLQLGDFSP